MPRSKLWWGYPSPRANPPAASGRNVVLRLRLAAPGITASTRTNRTRLLDLDAYFDRIQWRPDHAVARKLAVILRRMCVDGTEFNWSTKKAVAQRA